MSEISDLTKDTRPTLMSLITSSIKDTVEIDKSKSNLSGEYIEHENATFYYRVMFLFTQRASKYYSNSEIERWVRVELMNETILPKIKGYGLDNL